MPVELIQLVRGVVEAWAGRFGDRRPRPADRAAAGTGDRLHRSRPDPAGHRRSAGERAAGACRPARRSCSPSAVRRPAAPGYGFIEVRDGGPGFTDADLAVVFERGALYERYRGIRKVGSGLGLALAAGLVRRLGGADRGRSRTRRRRPVHGRDADPRRHARSLTGRRRVPLPIPYMALIGWFQSSRILEHVDVARRHTHVPTNERRLGHETAFPVRNDDRDRHHRRARRARHLRMQRAPAPRRRSRRCRPKQTALTALGFADSDVAGDAGTAADAPGQANAPADVTATGSATPNASAAPNKGNRRHPGLRRLAIRRAALAKHVEHGQVTVETRTATRRSTYSGVRSPRSARRR